MNKVTNITVGYSRANGKIFNGYFDAAKSVDINNKVDDLKKMGYVDGRVYEGSPTAGGVCFAGTSMTTIIGISLKQLYSILPESPIMDRHSEPYLLGSPNPNEEEVYDTLVASLDNGDIAKTGRYLWKKGKAIRVNIVQFPYYSGREDFGYIVAILNGTKN